MAKIENNKEEERFTWIPAYRAIAEKLLEYKDKRGELIELLRKIKSKGYPVINLKEKDNNNNEVDIIDIDPFSFMANFSRQITDNNRRAIIEEIQEAFNIEKKKIYNFNGVPIVDNQQSWFAGWLRDRESDDIDIIWDIFEAALNKELNKDIFNKCLKVKYLANKITMGLFWIDPYNYISLDSVNKDYFEQKLHIDKSQFSNFNIRKLGYDGYLDLLKYLKDNIDDPFYEISY